MVISNVSVETFMYPDPIVTDANGHIHPGETHQAEKTLLRIMTDEGHEGCAFGGDPDILEKVVKPALLGEDPLARERIWRRLREKHRIIKSFLGRDLHTVDLALWDLAGRIFQVPVYRLIGACRNKVKAYASTMCGDDYKGGLSTPDEYARFALQCRDRGYSAFKLHLWVSPKEGAPNWRKDIEACAAVKAAVGDSMRLMVDCSGGYNRNEALLFGRELQKLGYYWLEEPVDEAEIQSYVWLTNKLDITILGPETPKDMETRAEWVIRGASDMNRCGAQDVGGITPLIKAVHMYETFGMPFDMHMSDPGNLQVLGTTTMSEYYERGLVHPFIDYDQPLPYLNRIFDPMDSDGYVYISELPGIGLDINFEYIRENTIKRA
jgi:L-alanine-DL-glutamate epimerase-like enolase superfamily enzyme